MSSFKKINSFFLFLLITIIILLNITQITCASDAEDETDYYTLLGVSRDATTKEIKKAFRAKSLKYHPDRNPGDKRAQELYVKINRAQEVLTDPEKKEIYDIYGEEGLNKESNIQQRGKERGPNTRIELGISLEDLYNGATRQIQFERNNVCTHCHGTGGKLGKTKQCPICKGRGVRHVTVTVAFGMQMQMQQPCEKCNGKGIIFSEVCPHCKGRKIVRELKKLDIEIEKGMYDGQNILFKGQSEQIPDKLPGDLIVIIKQSQHHFFKERKGNDLYANVELNIKEALLGYKVKIKHLDGREFYIESNEVTQPNQVRKITGEGMPVHKFPSQKGDLYIKFIVKLPKTLNNKEKEMVKEILKE